MNFQPLTEENCLRQEMPIPPGEYYFEIFDAKDHRSQANNESIKLVLKVFTSDLSKNFTVYDFLLPAHDSMGFRVKRCCEALGLLDEYQKGIITPNMFIRKSGMASFDKQKDSKFLRVREYLKNKELPVQPTNEPNDDIPF